VIAGEMTPTLSRYVKKGEIRFLGKEFRKNHLDGAFVVIAATDDQILNCRISEQAREKGILINTVDQPSECNFIVPSVLRRGDLLIAVSTSGKSPALAEKRYYHGGFLRTRTGGSFRISWIRMSLKQSAERNGMRSQPFLTGRFRLNCLLKMS
jgi:precorrin-2 dehydrogenase/sirohydrochlorin ferrochelatase